MSLNPVAGGDVFSEASFAQSTEAEGSTDVVVDVKGPTTPLIITINDGGCDARGTVVQTLEPTRDGESITTLDADFASLLTGALSMHVGSPDDPAIDISCGVLPRAVTVALGPGRDGDETPADAVLLDQGVYGTEVSVFFTPEVAFAPQPVSIVQAACPTAGASAFDVAAANRGLSRSTIDVSVGELLAGGYSIQVGRSPAEPQAIVVCGDLHPG